MAEILYRKEDKVSDKMIRVSTETQRRLKELGTKGESYNDIIQRLLNGLVPKEKSEKGFTGRLLQAFR